jgi:signal peptidase I
MLAFFVLGGMMEEQFVGRRNGVGLFFVGLLLGPYTSMLWLGKWKLAIIYLIAVTIAEFLFFWIPVVGFTNPMALPNFGPRTALWLFVLPIIVIGLFHAFRLNNKESPRPIYSRWYIALVCPIVISFGLAFTIRTFLFQPFNIPSASNIPSLIIGDYVFVSKSAYGKYYPPQAGDMAVFKYPADARIDYVKRIVGVPGDHIQMVDGILNINGAPVKLEEVKLASFLSDQGIQKFYRETLPNGRSYVIAEMGNFEADNTEVYVVPDGHYFTLGDNRDNSQDSRFLDKVGYVPLENFVGPVVFRFWNSEGLPLIGRPEEIYPKP